MRKMKSTKAPLRKVTCAQGAAPGRQLDVWGWFHRCIGFTAPFSTRHSAVTVSK
jgi:hypothetical protein